MKRSTLVAPVLAVLAAAAMPSSAGAAVACSFDAAQYRLTVTSAGDSPTVRRSGDAIVVTDGIGPAIDCAGPDPTVTTTDTIAMSDSSTEQAFLVVDLGGGPLAPGHTSEGPYTTAEIEVQAAGGDGFDFLRVAGGIGADHFVAGTSSGQTRVNVDPWEALDDADVTATGVEALELDGGDGADEIDARGAAGTGAPLDVYGGLYGHGGADHIWTGAHGYAAAGAGDDTVHGSAGRDVIYPEDGDDSVDGGGGEDDEVRFLADAGVTVDLGQSGPQATGEGTDTIANVEWVRGADGDDVLVGSPGVDRLFGGPGNDRLEGRGGDDRLEGEGGRDTARYAAALAAVTVDLGAAAPQAHGGAGSDTLVGVEGVTGSVYDDVLFGDGGPNAVDGGVGGDTIEGRGGDDLLTGGGGAGADDPDYLDGGPGVDTISYAERAGPVAVALDGSAHDGATGPDGVPVEGDQDVEVENVVGGLAGDRLTGSAGPNSLRGGKGADVLTGGFGADVLDGGRGVDTISYGARTKRVAITLNGLADDGADPDLDGVSSAAEEGDQAKGIENVKGGAGNDALTGSAGRNSLKGGGGADVLTGGFGTDVLDGGKGIDTISYRWRTGAVAVTLDGVANDGADPDHDGSSAAGEERDRDVAIENATGGSGPDRLTALLAGVNRLTGGAGDDRLDAKDGSAAVDQLLCGAGTLDVFAGDPSDATSECEATPAP